MAKQQYLECGMAAGIHGVRGTLRLECWCDSPEVLAKLRTLYRKTPDGAFVPMKARASSVQKGMVLCSFEEITTREDAMRFKGTVFYADRNDLKLGKNDHFIADLIGLTVSDVSSGEVYGTLADVISPGGRDVYVVNDVRGGQFMIPVVAEFVREIETEGEGAGIRVSLIEGMRD